MRDLEECSYRRQNVEAEHREKSNNEIFIIIKRTIDLCGLFTNH